MTIGTVAVAGNPVLVAGMVEGWVVTRVNNVFQGTAMAGVEMVDNGQDAHGAVAVLLKTPEGIEALVQHEGHVH